jgi:hypothetical protein
MSTTTRIVHTDPPWPIPKHIEAEDDKYRNGKEYYSLDGALEENVDGQMGCVRKRHDGGLRFGADNGESEIYVVWVKRKELNSSKIPAPPQSGGAKHVKVEHNTYYM